MSLNYQQPQIFQNLSTTKVVAGTTEANFQDKKSNLLGRNFGLHVGDDHLKVTENYNDLKKTLLGQTDLPHIVPHQTHSKNVLVITKDVTIEPYYDDFDAIITNVDNLLIGVLSADCVPILLYDSKQQVIGAVHAGWKGTAQQIVKETVNKMVEVFLTQVKDIYVYIGPAIGQNSYEVDRHVVEQMHEKSYISGNSPNKYFLDLKLENQLQLSDLGIPLNHIEISNQCTYTLYNRYYSARRNGFNTGRMLSFIYLKNPSNKHQ